MSKLQTATEAIERLSEAVDDLGTKKIEPSEEMNKIELATNIAKATCESVRDLIDPLDMQDAKTALLIIPRQSSMIESKIYQARSDQIKPRSELRAQNADLLEDHLRPLLSILRIILNLVQPCPHRPLPHHTAREEEQ